MPTEPKGGVTENFKPILKLVRFRISFRFIQIDKICRLKTETERFLICKTRITLSLMNIHRVCVAQRCYKYPSDLGLTCPQTHQVNNKEKTGAEIIELRLGVKVRKIRRHSNDAKITLPTKSLPERSKTETRQRKKRHHVAQKLILFNSDGTTPPPPPKKNVDVKRRLTKHALGARETMQRKQGKKSTFGQRKYNFRTNYELPRSLCHLRSFVLGI